MLRIKTLVPYMMVLITVVLSETVANTMTANDQEYQFLFEFGSSGTGDGQFVGLCGVAVDSANNIIGADKYNNRIQVFDSSGNFLRKFGSHGAGDGQFNYPLYVAVDSTDRIVVSDAGNNRIQVFGLVTLPTPTPTPTPGAKGKISGFVVDTGGSPIKSAKVKTNGVKTKIKENTLSDAGGFFEFADLEADLYKITVKKRGIRKPKRR
ncbi:MAG: hypothetical protein CV087_06035 [Candidatus Brocadia sp. WS118]|nr:MAG: hypothetical protein CV087_06035 [Candidatus Brocadia sp. WS118]